MSDEICKERHKRVDERLATHETRLNAHAKQLDDLSISDATNKTEISSLCKQIADLVNTIKWLIGILVVPVIGGIIGFFFYAAQKGLIK